MIDLPQEFLDRMKQMLGEEYDAYLASYEEKSIQGLRVNTDKISPEEFCRIAPFHLEPVPWCENGFYCLAVDQVSKHPYYYAGLYYVQEPSAMLPAALLGAKPGERILDLCAAPGGKATETGSRLHRNGMLLANDISVSRAGALLKNIELSGIGNAYVCSETPEKLAARYEGYFDKVLVDAPCSGEGMFRRDPSMIRSYMKRGPLFYAPLQKEILTAAATMLKPGGRMVYSTCTFSREENEEILDCLREVDKSLRLLRKERLFPHRVKGEGHFAALLEKVSCEATCKDNAPNSQYAAASMENKQPPEWCAFQKENLYIDLAGHQIINIKDRLYALPVGTQSLPGLRYLRSGLFLGEIKKNRFEPSQALAMYLKKEEAVRSISFACDDPRVIRYLKGETPELSENESIDSGWTLVCVDGYPLGWGKCTDGRLKNKYYAGWRIG